MSGQNDVWRNVEHHIPRLRRYSRALTRNIHQADDLVQDTLVLALSKSHLWQPGTDLRAWLFTLMHNQYVNIVRRAVREGRRTSVDAALNLGHAATQHLPLQLRDLQEAINKLPEEQRAVLLLIGLEGMPYEHVAEMLCVPIGTIRSRLSRARSTLRELLQQDGPTSHCRPTAIYAQSAQRTAN